MDLNPYICDTLEPVQMPVCEGVKPGYVAPYIVFEYPDIRGIGYADDVPESDSVSVRLHLYVSDKTDYSATRQQIRALLTSAGFTYPSVQILYEPENNLTHLVFDTEITTIPELEE